MVPSRKIDGNHAALIMSYSFFESPTFSFSTNLVCQRKKHIWTIKSYTVCICNYSRASKIACFVCSSQPAVLNLFNAN